MKHAELPGHFTPHCLRHTYASVLISEGRSPAYVQAQLSHASISLTVDTYGKWLPKGDKAAVDSLDDACRHRSGDRVVTFSSGSTAVAVQVADLENGPAEDRTPNPLIKSQLLYQLSYRPTPRLARTRESRRFDLRCHVSAPRKRREDAGRGRLRAPGRSEKGD